MAMENPLFIDYFPIKLKPPFTGNIQLPCVITGGQVANPTLLLPVVQHLVSSPCNFSPQRYQGNRVLNDDVKAKLEARLHEGIPVG